MSNIASDKFKDQQGNSFASVLIGDQLWMAENLNVSCFWSSTESTESFAKYRFIRHDSDELFSLDYGKGDGFSCRCVKDKK